MKQKGSALLLALLLMFTAGCAARGGTAEEKLIVTSFYPMYVFTQNVAAGIEGVRVENMAQQSVGCLHDYQLQTRDMAMIEEADVLVITNRKFNVAMDEGLYDVILRCYMKNTSYQSSFVAPIALVNYLTRQLEQAFPKDIAARLANWDSLLGEDFFMV